ncbi:sulfatase family protein [Mariniphaga sediminis]|uniref:sulfatase family protein n=1 Tax=Mariniphaga sediminis TaxID=1628158 RepID=UPI00356B4953
MKNLSKKKFIIFIYLYLFFQPIIACKGHPIGKVVRPNILFAISDDQSFMHTSYAGANFVKTPAFDLIAKEGVYFRNCIAASPGCAPSRSSIVTGRYPWQNEQSGQHGSSWLKKYVPLIDVLDANGYYSGYTGKGVDPFQYARNENDTLWRTGNAAGKSFNSFRYKEGNPMDERPAKEISDVDYFRNFKNFLEHGEKEKPFFFWYGSHEPHRAFEQDSWKQHEKSLADVIVPDFLPEDDVVRKDILDYAIEIEWFDLHLQRMLEYLEKIGELENTVVIVTSDNGMAFPRAKANGYEYGIHVPLAIRFPQGFPNGRIVDDPVSFADLAPTILEITNTSPEGMLPISGKSILNILESQKQGIVDPSKKYVFSGRERHSSSRYKNWGYPQRMIRSKDFLYIWNIKQDRWPAGAPQRIKPGTTDELLPMYGIDTNGKHHSDWAFTDIDTSPTKSYIVEHHNEKKIKSYFDWAVAKRPEVEFFNIKNDPYCLNNLAGNSKYADIEKKMKDALMNELKKSEDPRVVGSDKEVFDLYKRYIKPMREFPKF